LGAFEINKRGNQSFSGVGSGAERSEERENARGTRVGNRDPTDGSASADELGDGGVVGTASAEGDAHLGGARGEVV
jgi:hypothetical protein